MLYVHGLLSPCGAPRVVPEGLVSAAPFALGKIVAESARPMILVVPRFQPGNDRSWSSHRLDRPGAINALFAEVLAETGRRLNRATPAIDQLIVAGHSRAFGILYPLARASASPELGKGALARLSRIWVFDATYGTPPIAAFESSDEGETRARGRNRLPREIGHRQIQRRVAGRRPGPAADSPVDHALRGSGMDAAGLACGVAAAAAGGSGRRL